MSFGSGNPVSNPDCWKCRHFFITFEEHHRYGCRAMGFKARELPALEVLQADGASCLSFSRKTVEHASESRSTKLAKKRSDNLINLKC